MKAHLKSFGVLLVAITLTSCGGGGGGGSSSGGGSSPPPSASPPSTPTISSSLSSALTGQSITFRASATDPGSLALTYSWEFGDGTTDTGASVNKTYNKAGNFTVRVTVTNTASRSSSATITQAVTWRDLTKSWTRRLGQYGSTTISGVSKTGDGGGNTGVSYVVGTICCRNVFEGQQPVDGIDSFITRMNADGTTAWTRVIGGTEGTGISATADDKAFAVLALNDGVYVVGSTDARNFYGQANNGGRDVFIVKFGHDGTRLWAKLFGGVADDEAFGVTIGKPVGSRETINIAGVTRSATFQGQSGNGSRDAFALQIDTNGGVVWARLTGSTGDDVANGIVLARDGSLYLTGSTTSVSLDGQQLNNQQDAFVTKLSSDGTKVWTRLVGGTAFEVAYGIDAETDGSAVYIAGYTNSSTIEGASANSGSTAGDLFLTKLSSDGVKVWTRTLGDSGTDEGKSVSVASDGSIYVVGSSSSLVIDSKATNGGTDLFITKFVADGTRAYSFVSGGTSTDEAFGVAVLADGSILIGGSSNSPIVDGKQRIGVVGGDALIIKYALAN
jgi:hypothetical protein